MFVPRRVPETNVLSNDPLLWFIMMLMPVGPSALKLMALADVNGADQEVKMSIAKFLTVSEHTLAANERINALTHYRDIKRLVAAHLLLRCGQLEGFTSCCWQLKLC